MKNVRQQSIIQLKEFVEKFGEPYSKQLGIRIECGDKEIVKWFLAAILYGKPIREASATNTYRCFERHGVLTADRIVRKGWKGLVSILDEGGYTRYDFSTADMLLQVFGNLQKEYGSSLSLLHEMSSNSEDLERRLKLLGKGIGDVTVSIFLRDMRPIWPKAKPEPAGLVKMAMEYIGITDLDNAAKNACVDVVRLETALLRLAKNFLKKRKTIKIKI
ncbi:MAG: hypothetical protein QXU32_06700 [Nitrososphaerales archaeon]